MKRYVKYLRKSRFDRDYAELSVEETLKRHESILDKMASDRGYHIAKTYYEVVSGESIAARPEIQKLLEEVSAGLYEGVLVVDLERLARGNGADQAYISQVFQFSETKIITPLKTYDPSNEFDEEYFEFGLFMSRREYKTINRRLIRGRESSASEGKYLGSIAPYGYRKVKIGSEKGYTLEPDPNEAHVVITVYEMFINGAGTKIIANYLNDEKIPTRKGDLWSYSSISNMLRNPVYVGMIKRGWAKQIKSIQDGVVVKKVKHLTDESEYTIYKGLHPPLIREEMFQKAKEIAEAKKPAPKVKKEFELQNAFAGLIFCSKCGKRIGRSMDNRGNPRFRCINDRNCPTGSCSYDLAEEQIIESLSAWLKGYKLKITTNDFEEDIVRYQKFIYKANEQIGKLEKQLEKAFDLVEQGVYTLAVFQERREKLTLEISEAKKEIVRATKILSDIEEKSYQQTNLVPQTEQLLESYNQMTPQEKNDLLKQILYKVEYTKETYGSIEIDIYPKLPKL